MRRNCWRDNIGACLMVSNGPSKRMTKMIGITQIEIWVIQCGPPRRDVRLAYAVCVSASLCAAIR
jgi:hypothetical protein